jgi:hypothetical protein
MNAAPPVPMRTALSRPDPPARLISLKPAPRSGSALYAYVTVAFGALVINDIPLFRTENGGLSVGVPGVPELGPDGRQREQDGRKKYRPILGFLTLEGRRRYERMVLDAVVAGIGGAP